MTSETSMAGLIGPVLEATAPGDRPQPMPACATCPKAMWYRSSKRLRTFCRELRIITWQDGEQDPILECDGREAASIPLQDQPA